MAMGIEMEKKDYYDIIWTTLQRGLSFNLELIQEVVKLPNSFHGFEIGEMLYF
jgi:hypothetical protein